MGSSTEKFRNQTQKAKRQQQQKTKRGRSLFSIQGEADRPSNKFSRITQDASCGIASLETVVLNLSSKREREFKASLAVKVLGNQNNLVKISFILEQE